MTIQTVEELMASDSPPESTLVNRCYCYPVDEYTYEQAKAAALASTTAEYQDAILHEGYREVACQYPSSQMVTPAVVPLAPRLAGCPSGATCKTRHWRIGVWFSITGREQKS